MKTQLVWLVLAGLGLGTAAHAQQRELGIDLDATFVSKYIWRGYDIYGDRGAFQPSVNFDLFGTGFSANVWASIPLGSGNEESTEVDYTLAYGFSLFEGEAYAIDAAVNYIYFDYVKANRKADCHELGIGLTLPNLLRIGDTALVPGYYVGRIWPASSCVSDAGGAFHVLSLGFDVPVGYVPALGEGLVLSFLSDLTYNDGAFGADHDWSHATFGVSTSFLVGPFTVTPFVNYQISMDDSVNTENELWSGISFAMRF